MKKLILSLIIITLCTVSVQAKTIKKDCTDIIKSFDINKNSISISIRDAKNGNVVYSLNDKILMNPASVQKVLTLPAVTDALGTDYKFKTTLYSAGQNDYLIKLGADPYLKYSDLKTLVAPVKRDTTRQIYIDDSIIDSNTWGEGWQWDDDLNVLMPRFGAYNLDKNLIKISIIPQENTKNTQIVNASKYPVKIINNVTFSDKTSVDVKRDITTQLNTLTISGTIARPTNILVPTYNIKEYFENQLTRALENNKVYLKTKFVQKNKQNSDNYITEISHEYNSAIDDILKNSNNMIAETVFKLSGAKIYGKGTAENGIKVFNDYCKKHNIDNSEIRITDGSGVSKNNLVNADFVSNYLYINRDNPLMTHLPKPGEGTLTQRMLPISNNLRAKTGTLSNISSIAGFITTKSGHKYTFCIIQNDVKMTDSDKKMLEDYIIRDVYLKL